MQIKTSTLFNRSDTLFGVCEGVGRDFRIHPNILRLALAMLLLWNPLVVLGTYAALGVAVAVSRWIAPVPASLADTAASSSEAPIGEEAGYALDLAA